MDSDTCYIHVDPNVNNWHKGTAIRKVIGVPDLYVIHVDGHHYRQNKRDLTLVPPSTSNEESEKSDGDSHQDKQRLPMRAVVRPTLCPRQTPKFPRLPVQATQQRLQIMNLYLHIY